MSPAGLALLCRTALATGILVLRLAAAQLGGPAVLPAPAPVGAAALDAGVVACWGNPQPWSASWEAAAAPAPAPSYDGLGPSASSTASDGGGWEWDGGWDMQGGAPPTAVPSRFRFITISAQDSYACGVTTGSQIACFGSTTPLAPDAPAFQPPTLVPSADTFLKVVTGPSFACGLLTNYSAACFGQLGGELWSGGDGDAAAPTPRLVAGGEQFLDLAAGADHACGILFNGTAACFGSNAANQLGHPSSLLPSSAAPLAIADHSLTFTSLAAAADFSCGVLVNASAVCWGGYADAGQAALLPATPRPLGPGLQFGGLAARGGTVCGLTWQEVAVCEGVVGSFIDADGYPETLFAEQPEEVAMAGLPLEQLAVGGSGFFFHACGLTAEGRAYCWGLNNRAQLGAPPKAAANSTAPLAVEGGLLFSQLSAGGDYTCGVVASP